jgi:hypothetical protein
MRRRLQPLVLIPLLLVALPLRAHDMFWRLTAWFVEPGQQVVLPVLNGTFSLSSNSISWDRVADLSVVSPAGRAHPDSASWDTRGDTTRLRWHTEATGTYVAGLSTKPRVLSMKAVDFEKYLADDGIPDVLAARRAAPRDTTPVRERYSKHIKTFFQVGPTRTDGWRDALGYAAELVPLSNPYEAKRGATIAFRCLVDGRPVFRQLVVVGGRVGSTGDARLPSRELRSDNDGVVRVVIDRPGRWYVKFIHMVRVNDPDADYQSKWATATFEVR